VDAVVSYCICGLQIVRAAHVRSLVAVGRAVWNWRPATHVVNARQPAAGSSVVTHKVVVVGVVVVGVVVVGVVVVGVVVG
jgi:hypothetical protein